MPSAEQHFREVAPKYMVMLLADFPRLNKLDAAAVFGNLAHESLGFTTLQEITPTVKGSRGGYGWAQWTVPRRRAFEAYAKRNSLDLNADATNYKFLFVELRGDEAKAIDAVRAAVSLGEKVVAFEKAFLRAGVKHYESRKRWAVIALDAYEKADWKAVEANPAPDSTQVPETASPAATGILGLVAALFKLILSLFARKPQ